MRCPGQDPRYWKEDAVFETPCPKCDTPVEFFKDESSRRCSKCGCKFPNPKVSFDCAQWCAYAEQCLGFVPERQALANPGEGALASRLIQEVKGQFEGDQTRLARALTVFQHARELLSREGGDPRIVLAAALLVELAVDEPAPTPPSAEKPTPRAAGLAKSRQILASAGLEEDTVECVLRILESCRTDQELDTIEFRVVCDADTLANLPEQNRHDDPDKLREMLTKRLRTGAGRSRAKALFLSR